MHRFASVNVAWGMHLTYPGRLAKPFNPDKGLSMWLVWGALLLIVLKWLEVDPVASWSWYWVLAPLLAAFIWFEFLERAFGRDKRSVEMAEYQKRAQERLNEAAKLNRHRP